MQALLSESLPFVYFIYGLSFFLSGYTLLFLTNKKSSVDFTKEIKYFALFFLLHGLADWAPVFYPLLRQLFSQTTMNYIEVFQLLLLGASFYFLFIYGIKVLFSYYKCNKCVLQIPNLIITFWLIFSVIVFSKSGFALGQAASMLFLRYLIGFPSILLSAFVFKNEISLLNNLHSLIVKKYLQVAYYTLILYAFSTIIVSKAPFFPANILNTDNFISLFGFPVQFLRAFCGVVTAYSIMQILETLHIDFIKKVERVEKDTAIYEERERISQDFHDGTMQTLFGVGLRLKHIEDSLDSENTEYIKEHLNYAIEKIDAASREIRTYITDLRATNDNSELISEIKDVIDNFIKETGIKVHFDYKKTQNYDIKTEISSQLSFIIKEALNNIRKHAQATLVQVDIVIYQGKLELIIQDNGNGFEYEKDDNPIKTITGFGLKNIKKRVENLKGFVKFNTSKGKGTEITINIPIL